MWLNRSQISQINLWAYAKNPPRSLGRNRLPMIYLSQISQMF